MDDDRPPGNQPDTEPTEWFVSTGGHVYGPIDRDSIRQWLAEGRLGPDWWARPPESDAWSPPGGVPELADLATAAPPPPRLVSEAEPADAPPPVGDILGEGWELWKRHWFWGIGLFLSHGLLAAVPSALPLALFLVRPWDAWPQDPFPAGWLVVAACGIIWGMVSIPIGVGITACYIDTARTGEASYHSLTAGFGQWSSMSLLMLAIWLVSGLPGGNIVMILAGPVLFALTWVIADRQRGIVDAVKHIAPLLTDRYWWVLLVTLLTGLIQFAGFMLCGVGLALSAPAGALMGAVLYLHLAERQGWDASVREPATGGRLALEVLPMLGLTAVLLGVLGVVYWVVF